MIRKWVCDLEGVEGIASAPTDPNRPMTAQILEIQAINDQELEAINGGWMGSAGGLLGGIQTGIAANRVGINLGDQGAGTFAIGAMIAQGENW